MSRRRFFWLGDELASDTWRKPRVRISAGGRAHDDRNVRFTRSRWVDTTRIIFTLIQKYAPCYESNSRTVRKPCLIRCLGNRFAGIGNFLAVIYFGPNEFLSSSAIVIRVKNITDTIFGFVSIPSSTNSQESTGFTMPTEGEMFDDFLVIVPVTGRWKTTIDNAQSIGARLRDSLRRILSKRFSHVFYYIIFSVGIFYAALGALTIVLKINIFFN